MSEILTSSLASTVTGQVAQLALAAVTLAALATVLLLLQRGVGRQGPSADAAADEPTGGTAVRPVLLSGVLLLAVLALILAAGLRQVWAHPVLQPRALWSLVAVLLVGVLVWWRRGQGEERP